MAMPPQIGDRLHIRWMIRRDFPEVLEIAHAFPGEFRSAEELCDLLRARNRIGMVATLLGYPGDMDAPIVGYFVYEMTAKRLIVRHFAVMPGQWGRGIGRRMISRLIGKLAPWRRTRLDFDVPDDNLPMHLFLRAMGFRAVMLPTTDTYRFTYLLPTAVPDGCEGAIP